MATRPMTKARTARPHMVTTYKGRTWGERMLDQKRRQDSRRRGPEEYFAEQHTRYAQVNSDMLKTEEGLSHGQGKVYYMNTPEDSRLKNYLHELGRYQHPMLEGMYNPYEEIQENAVSMMSKRIEYGKIGRAHV